MRRKWMKRVVVSLMLIISVLVWTFILDLGHESTAANFFSGGAGGGGGGPASAVTSPFTLGATTVTTTGTQLNFLSSASGTTGGLTSNLVFSASPVLSGAVGIGVASPTAALQLPAGTATASSAPLKLTSGTNMTTPEVGAIEFTGTALSVTGSDAIRRTVQTSQNIQSGQCTLDGVAPSDCTLAISYSTSTSYVCTVSRQTGTFGMSVTRTSATAVTVVSSSGTDTGVVSLICHGT